MRNKMILLVAAILLASTATLGGLFAQGGTTAITIKAAGTNASGAVVTPWSVGTPSWNPIEGAVGTMSFGGIARITLPNNPASDWSISLYLDDPNELIRAYSFWNPKVQIRTVDITMLTSGTSAIPSVANDGNADQSTFMHGTVVTNSLSGETYQTLTLEKGFVTFNVSSADGVPVNANDVYDTSSPVNRVFEIGFSIPDDGSNAGTFFTKDADNDDDLSPEFTFEVKQR